MSGNTFGTLFKITTFGESHGEALGVIIDGIPGGLPFSHEDLQKELERRRPGRVEGTTTRNEADHAEVLSGVFQNKTLGSPISVIVRNTNQRSQDYDGLKSVHRPGHADRTTEMKYGIRDHRGGGRSSGRETVSRVIGGYFAQLVIPQIQVKAFVRNIGPFKITERIPQNVWEHLGDYGYADSSKNEEIKKYLLKLKNDGNSVGGKVCIIARGVPTGLGEPAFDKLKADLAKALMSIGAVTSFSYGLGEDFSEKLGSEVTTDMENFGGMEGGISNGELLYLHVTIRPPSTVGDNAKQGRHDPCIIPRALPVLESMVKMVLADHYLRQRAYQK